VLLLLLLLLLLQLQLVLLYQQLPPLLLHKNTCSSNNGLHLRFCPPFFGFPPQGVCVSLRRFHLRLRLRQLRPQLLLVFPTAAAGARSSWCSAGLNFACLSGSKIE